MNTRVMRLLALPALLGLVLGLLGAAAVYAVAASKPAQYQARVGLVLQPKSKNGVVDSAYPTVMSANLPAAAEYLYASQTLARVKAAVPGAPDTGAISAGITADLIPASALLRVSSKASTPELAQQLAMALGHELVGADIFGGVAAFQLIDKEAPAATQVAPDKKLAMGLALLAGVICGGAACGAWMLLMPRLLFRSQAKRIVDDPGVAVLDLTSPAKAARARSVLDALGEVELRPLGVDRAQTLAQATEALGDDLAVRDGAPLVIVAPLGRSAPSELSAAMAVANRTGRRVDAVALV